MLRTGCAPRFAFLTLSSLILALATVAPAQTAAAEEFIKIEWPVSAEVRVENNRGGVAVEVWDESHVGVAYETSGAVAPAARPKAGRRATARAASPVRIDKSNSLLLISVPRTGVRASSRVDLRLRVPAGARLKIFTADGAVELRGVPAQVAAQTVSGDIRLSLPVDAGADITAHSLNGAVEFDDGRAGQSATRAAGRKLQTRLGAGGNVARLFSGRGRISLTTSETTAVNMTARGNVSASRRTLPMIDPDQPNVERAPAGIPARVPADVPEEVDEDDVVRVDTGLVTLNVSVIERASGRGIAGLTREDFRLFEDGAQQQLIHFESATAPFDLLLLVDLSGSTAKVTDLIRNAALRFIAATRPQDRIAVVAFAGANNVVSPLTTDRRALRTSIERMAPPSGDTRLYDAVNFALDELARDANTARRRAVILMSDGLDSTLPNVTGNGSALPYGDVLRRVQEDEAVFYSIWVNTEHYEALSPLDIQPETFDLAHDRLRDLADAGGGVFYELERLEDLAGAYEKVVEDLGTVYSLSYQPTNKVRDGSWRAISIRLPGRATAVARGKRGYFAN